jgi:hypothetical protein
MSEDPYLPRFLVRRDARRSWMVWDRLTKGPAMFQGRLVAGLAEDHAREIKDELTSRACSNATPILFPLIQTVRQLRITRFLSVIN